RTSTPACAASAASSACGRCPSFSRSCAPVTSSPALLPRCTFPAPGTEVTCAVSGGADSLALLLLATAAGCQVTAVHVDHGLRDGSAGEAELVEAVARRVGAGFRAERAQVAPGPNLEERARQVRYSMLP